MKFLPVIRALPPNFAAIDAAFQVAGSQVIFAYGGAIYNPAAITISVELQAHEAVHCERQGTNPNAWWERYIADSSFRFDEELLAHQAEYATYCRRHLDRNKRSRYLDGITQRLCSNLYRASNITRASARRLIAA